MNCATLYRIELAAVSFGFKCVNSSAQRKECFTSLKQFPYTYIGVYDTDNVIGESSASVPNALPTFERQRGLCPWTTL